MTPLWEWLLAAFALLQGASMWLVMRSLERKQRQIARLMRRVWLLEGSPRGDA